MAYRIQSVKNSSFKGEFTHQHSHYSFYFSQEMENTGALLILSVRGTTIVTQSDSVITINATSLNYNPVRVKINQLFNNCQNLVVHIEKFILRLTNTTSNVEDEILVVFSSNYRKFIVNQNHEVDIVETNINTFIQNINNYQII